MAHIRVTQEPNGAANYSVLVDGVDLTARIHAEGFSVVFPSTPDGQIYISCRLAVESFDIDIAGAEVRPWKDLEAQTRLASDIASARALVAEMKES